MAVMRKPSKIVRPGVKPSTASTNSQNAPKGATIRSEGERRAAPAEWSTRVDIATTTTHTPTFNTRVD